MIFCPWRSLWDNDLIIRNRNLPSSKDCSLTYLFPAFLLWTEAIERSRWLWQSRVWRWLVPSVRTREGAMRSWPECKPSSHPVSERSAAEPRGTAGSGITEQRALSSSASWWPPCFRQHDSALPCRVGDCPYSGNKINSFEFRKKCG